MKYTTAGESHGPALSVIVTDVPYGIELTSDKINADLARRQSGYGRGGRMKIEADKVEILSGLRFGKTIGSPVAMQITNRDWQNWSQIMAHESEPPSNLKLEQSPRPGHADLVGALKYDTFDCRDILERASARESAARVAAGAVAKAYLEVFGVAVSSYVTGVGDVEMPKELSMSMFDIESGYVSAVFGKDFLTATEASVMRCPDEQTTLKMCQAIDAARAEGESLGGTFVVAATGMVAGLGGYAQGSDRLNSQIAAALFSIPAIKGVEFGLGFKAAKLPGSKVHDPIFFARHGSNSSLGIYSRTSNNAGGLEGGMTTGAPILARVAMKPIPTLTKPLQTVNIASKLPEEASKERSDVCAVPAAAVVAEAELALVLARAYMNKFGHDSYDDAVEAFLAYANRINRA